MLKSVDPVPGDDVPLGDRVDMAYMNSTVTRGRGEMVVTATGMATEVGQISGMLSQVQQEKTPLTRQLDQLTVLITIMAAAALALVIVIGLIRGEDFDDLFLVGISLAIAAIPTGLPAVVTTVLSLGTQALAAKGAIVKRLRSVETLGSTSAICSDKTGTLTLNQMTARQLVVAGRRYSIDGEGYFHRAARSSASPATPTPRSSRSCCRWRSRTTPRSTTARSSATRPRPRSSCSRRRAGSTSTRRGGVYPRVGRGAVRLRVQVHGDVPRDGGRRAQGRPLLRQGRAGRPARALVALRDVDGSEIPDRRRPATRSWPENDRLAGEGLRVLAVASRDFDPDKFNRTATCSTRSRA